MTYRLSIPTPLEGVLSHITTAAVSYYRDWTPTSLIIIGQNFGNENGNWYELYCQLFLLCLPFRELE